MSIVRMCAVTISLFRTCMCMCLRARQRERRERSTKAGAADVELFPVLDSSSNSSCLAKVKQELRMVPKHTQFFESHSLTRPSLPCVLTAVDLESNLGPFSPKRVSVEFKDPLQDKFFQRRLRMGLRWLSNNFHEHYQEFLNRIENETAEQEEPTLILKERGEGAEQLTSSSISQFPQFTIAWSECDSCDAEIPSCKAQQRIADGRVHADVAELDEKLKTLVDEIIETGQTPCSDAESLTNFGDTCQCSQLLPNQIVATCACTTNFWIKQDFQAGLTTRMPGEHRDSCTMTGKAGEQREGCNIAAWEPMDLHSDSRPSRRKHDHVKLHNLEG